MHSPRKSSPPRETGQTLVLFMIFLAVLVLFVGLGIDLAYAYISKAQISKAVDAAALAGIQSVSQGTLTASSVASSIFAANYGIPGRDVGSITPSLAWSGNTQLTVTATTTINTFFIRILPTWKTLKVSANAQATRAPLIMTMVLDDSISMALSVAQGGSGGGVYLPGAVTAFVNTFDESIDKVAMVSFGTVQSNVVCSASPAQPTSPFKTPIINAVNAFTYPGATFCQGGLTNALALENSLINSTAVKAVVFLTDGWPNIFQLTMNCSPSISVNIGGQIGGSANPTDPCIGIYDPVTGNQLGQRNDTGTSGCGTISVYCSAMASYRSSIDNTLQPFIQTNVSAEAQFRSIQVARDMRNAGIYVYAIGTGDANLTFLQQIANDPALPNQTPTSYDGEAVLASDPSQLQSLFQTVAAKILTRLSK